MALRRRVARNELVQDANKNHWECNLFQVLHRMIIQGIEPKERGRAYYLKQFEKTRPSLCDVTPNFDIIEGWIQEIRKRNLNTLNVPVCFRIGLSTYNPNGKPDYLQDLIRRERNIDTITWEAFKEMFY